MENRQRVYIKGVPYRGDEVIKTLVDLGGRNEDNLCNAEMIIMYITLIIREI